MRQLFRAPWLLPIEHEPIRDGWIAVDAHRIVAIGGRGETPPAGFPEVAVTGAAILPGLVNAHAHLELSWMRDQVPPAPSMPPVSAPPAVGDELVT